MLRDRLYMPIVLAMASMMYHVVGDMPLPTYLLVEFVIVSVIWFFIWPVLYRGKLRRALVRLKDSGDLELDEETMMEFEENHFSKSLPDAMRCLNYSMVRSVNVEKAHIFITVRGRQTIVIPRNCMPDGGDALAALLEEKCGKDKIRR